MINVFNQLQAWSIKVDTLKLTLSIIDKLGDHALIAQENDKLVTVFTFLYKVDNKKVSGFLVVPKNITKPLPVLIYNRGGTGDYGLLPKGRFFTRIAEMAKWGYIVVGTQYPGNALSEGHDERGGASDIKSIVLLKDLIDGLDVADADNIGMVGESRGGMMTYLLLKQVTWIKAAVTIGGLANLERSVSKRPEMREVFETSFGNTKEGITERSAVMWPERMNKAPICLIHGGSDDTVSPLDSIELAEKLESIGHKHSLHIIEGGNHGLTNKVEERDAITRNWLDAHLKGAKNE